MNPYPPLLALLAGATLASCGAEAVSTPTTPPPTDQTGTVAVQLQDVEGFFIEGFEVGLRFETADGEVIATTLWSDFVNSQGEPSLEDYYDNVLEQSVPAGDIVVLAEANVGIGPGPEIPDIDGDLRCRLNVQVPANGRVDVEVAFDEGSDCLQLL